MLQNPVRPVIVRIRSTYDANDRNILAVSSGDGVEDAESTDRERNNTGADAAGPSVAVGGVSSVELVAAGDEVEAGISNEMIEESEVEVTGNGEDVGDADLDETASQVAA